MTYDWLVVSKGNRQSITANIAVIAGYLNSPSHLSAESYWKLLVWSGDQGIFELLVASVSKLRFHVKEMRDSYTIFPLKQK